MEAAVVEERSKKKRKKKTTSQLSPVADGDSEQQKPGETSLGKIIDMPTSVHNLVIIAT